MDIKEKFWVKKKVLVTGHTGFVGAWMCFVLKYMGAEVYGVALEAQEESLYENVREKLHIKEYIQDIRDSESVLHIINSIKPDIVIHLAAYGFVKECYEKPQRAYSTNVIGTVNILEAVRNCDSVKSILIISSDKVYQNDLDKNDYLFSEEDKLGGEDPYSCSKTCEDLIAKSYFYMYLKCEGKKLNIVRPGNILGGGDHIKTRLLPNMLEKFEKDELLEIRHPGAVRPWQHILDAIDAYLHVVQETYADSESKLGVFNVGPNMENQMSVGEIAKYISDKFASPKLQFGSESNGVKESAYLGIDITKIGNELGWAPKKNIKGILDDTYSFWAKSQSEDWYEVCREQIESYYCRCGEKE